MKTKTEIIEEATIIRAKCEKLITDCDHWNVQIRMQLLHVIARIDGMLDAEQPINMKEFAKTIFEQHRNP